jgi:hypothetical protein
VKNLSEERMKLRRLNFLDCATIPTRLLDRQIFPALHAALVKGANNDPQGKADFVDLCREAKIPSGTFVDSLWNTLLHVHNEMTNMPGWIPG